MCSLTVGPFALRAIGLWEHCKDVRCHALNEAAGGAGLDVGGLDVSSFLTGPITDSKYCLPPTPELPDAGPLPMPAQDAAAADAGAADAGSSGGDV